MTTSQSVAIGDKQNSLKAGCKAQRRSKTRRVSASKTCWSTARRSSRASIYRAAMLGEQGVPRKYGSKRQNIEIDAIKSLQQLFARVRQVRGSRRGSVVAV